MKLARLLFSTLLVASAAAPHSGAERWGIEFPGSPGDDKKDAKAEKAKRDAAAKDAAKLLRTGLKAEEPQARNAALEEASKVDHPAVVAAMAKALSDDEVVVRRTTIQLLGRMRSEEALKRLENFARREKRTLSEDEETNVQVIKSIARHRDPDSLTWLLGGALEDRSYQVRKARVFGAANQRTPEALEALFAAMNKFDVRRLPSRMRELRTGLIWLTGMDLGDDPHKWSAWWHKNSKSFEIPATPPKLSGRMQSEWAAFWGLERSYERRKKRGDRG